MGIYTESDQKAIKESAAKLVKAEATIKTIEEFFAADFKSQDGCKCVGCRIKAVLDKHNSE